MRADETILFTDLDGTLFNTEGKVSPETRAAVERYLAAGGRFALATGRAPSMALRDIAGLQTNAPSILLNGAAVCDLRTGEYAERVCLDWARVAPVVRRAMERAPGADLQAYTGEDIFYCTPEETAQPEFLKLHRPVRFVSTDELADILVVKLLFLAATAEEHRALGDYLRAQAAGRYDLVPGTVVLGAPLYYHELLPLGANKGTALRRLRTHSALAGRTILAAGDYWNDYELLREADVPICPANAIDGIKAICKYVTVSNDESAVARIIDEIIPEL